MQAREEQKSRTLQIKIPIGQTLLLSVLILVLMVGAAEAVARYLNSTGSGLPSPSWGLYHYMIELKLHRLDKLIAGRGEADVIFLGSSMVNRGINPKVFDEEFQRLTGKTVNSFNVGIPGIKSKDAYLLSKILVDRYKPKLIVYGASLRDFDGQNEPTDIPENPWIRYKTVGFNLDGWLRDHLLSYQYYLIYRNWMKEDFETQLKARRYYDRRLTPKGYARWDSVMGEGGPAWEEDAKTHFAHYFFDQPYLEALHQMLDQQDHTTAFLVVEMPVESSFSLLYPRQQEDQDYFIQQMGAASQEHGTLFWPTTNLVPIPEDGWYSKNHMNSTGATAFSRWLAYQVFNASPDLEAMGR